ncbi:MAG: LysE family translocator [Alphaproteobacteria bacterium]|nr:LysE family translocator [Alphaproteobacteria bacterium]
MFETDTLIAFVTAAVILSFIPGPDNLFVLTQSAIRGKTTGIVVTLGLCTGLIAHSVAVAFGVAAIFQTSQTAFTVLKVIGAAYLLYLAFQAFRAKPDDLGEASTQNRGLLKMYVRGILMNVTNPKVAIFFLAFLPQFTAPDQGNMAMQMLVLGGLFIVSALVSFSAISLAAGALSHWIRTSAKGQIILNRIAGVIFLGLAAKLVTAEN